MTNFWEHLFKGLSAKEAGELEEQQGVNIAIAASRTPTLEQYIWSTVVPASKISGGEHPVPHSDYKAGVDIRIRNEFPELATKTTFLYVGFYPTNLVYYPQIKPIALVGSYPSLKVVRLILLQASGKFIWLQPVRPTTTLPMAGDMNINPGVVVRQILAHPEKSKGRYATVWSEIISMQELLDIWSTVTGKEAVYVQVPADTFATMWGAGGRELAEMFKFCEAVSDWTEHRRTELLSVEVLGIEKGELIGMQQSLESLKALLI